MDKKRCFFAGTNSGRGFYSFFKNIIVPETKLVYLLKGGPGTGKSRFMGDLVPEVSQAGYDVELFFCSSDSESLDAVAFPQLGAAIIDATNPHALEAERAGYRDELICLGEFWNGKNLREQRAQIEELGRQKSRHFAEAFNYFQAARLLEENISLRNEIDDLQTRTFLGSLYAYLERQRESHNVPRGKARRLFASALTPQGYVSHLTRLVQGYQKVRILAGQPGTGKSACLEKAAYYALEAGFAVEIFHYPLDPHKVFHVLVPQLGLALLTSHPLERLEGLSAEKITFGNGDTYSNHNLQTELLHRGINALQKAQASHGLLEKYYRTEMDFQAVEARRNEVLQEILSL